MKNIINKVVNKLGIITNFTDGQGNRKIILKILKRRLDMNKKDAYIYYSGATDKTGQALADALKINGTRKKPPTSAKIIIGWGAKTKEKTPLGKAVVLNHPDNIRSNRNKLSTLETLKKAGVPVASFVGADKIMDQIKNKKMSFPVIGRTKYHQGGKGLWICVSELNVKTAIQEGAQYFQTIIPIKDEYRLHIFNGERIYTQRKTQRDDMGAAFKEQHADKIKHHADKNKKKLDADTMDYVLSQLGKSIVEKPDMLVRSNTRGWKFSRVTKDSKTLKALEKVCVNALNAMNLQFGAVDCCVDENGDCWVIEINSGPGLEESSFNAYVAKFESTIKDIINPKKAEKVKVTNNNRQNTGAAKPKTKDDPKQALKNKLDLLSEMIDHADDQEMESLKSVAAKMFRD